MNTAHCVLAAPRVPYKSAFLTSVICLLSELTLQPTFSPIIFMTFRAHDTGILCTIVPTPAVAILYTPILVTQILFIPGTIYGQVLAYPSSTSLTYIPMYY